MQATESAIADYQAIFANQRYSAQDACEHLETDAPRAKLHRTKGNGAQVYRTTEKAGRYYLLVRDGKILAVGPPSDAYPPGPSYERWTAKPGEAGPAWWTDQEGDTEAPRERPVEGLAPGRETVLPIVAEVRALAEEAGWTNRMIADRLGFTGKRVTDRVGQLWRGHHVPKSDLLAQLEALAGELRRVLNKPRPAHRPRSQAEALDQILSLKVTRTMSAWVTEKGGAAYVRGLIERDMR